MAENALMPISGLVDVVPGARTMAPGGYSRSDLAGLPPAIAPAQSEVAGSDTNSARQRSKQVFRWIYHCGITNLAAMTEMAERKGRAELDRLPAQKQAAFG